MATLLEPPRLTSLVADLSVIPPPILDRTASDHVRYLDDRINRIGPLTRYLRRVDTWDSIKSGYIHRVREALHGETDACVSYTSWYNSEFTRVRSQVDGLLAQVPHIIAGGVSDQELCDFWELFSYWNEIDNFHGMFLTSGRWDVNFMMPILRVCLNEALERAGHFLAPREVALLTEYLVTPRFSEFPPLDPTVIIRATDAINALLRPFDSDFLFLFNVEDRALSAEFDTPGQFARYVQAQPAQWLDYLERGVFLPFAWHELHANRDRRPSAPHPVPTEPASEAVVCLRHLKRLELNYHIYNYKGRFGLLSKPLYYHTAKRLPPGVRKKFLRTILLDAFSDAAELVWKDLRR